MYEYEYLEQAFFFCFIGFACLNNSRVCIYLLERSFSRRKGNSEGR